MKMIELANGTLARVAEYKSQDIEEYRGNPFVEALPPIYSQQEVIDRLSVYPAFHKQERYLEDHKRVHFIQRLLHYFQPLPIHLRIQSSVDRLIRGGYVSRNPLSKEYAKGFVDNWSNIQNQSFDHSVIQTGQTMSIVGVSGVGKTRSLQRIFDMIPQVISHTEFKNHPLNHYQVTYLKIETPFDGSVKTIIFDFMYRMDLLMGTDYFNRYCNSRLSTSQLMPIMAQIAKSANLGVLIIDEIQHLKAVKSKNSSQVLNFFTTLINTVNIPLIMIGTPKAMDVLQSQFRQARRSTNMGNVMWDRLKKDELWDLFAEGMWRYQWTKEETPFSEEISSVLYDVSQGVFDIAVKTVMMCQLRAISTGEERITGELLRMIGNEELKMVQPMLDALKNHDYRRLADYDDLSFPDIEKFLEQEQMILDHKQVMQSLQKGVDSKKEMEKLIDDAVFRLNILGIDEAVAKKTVSKIVAQEVEVENLGDIVQKAFRILTSPQKDDDLEENERDLRSMVEKGKNNDLSAYQALLEAGVIKQDYPGGDAS